MSPSSPQALYHPIPQAPVASNPVLRRSDVELDADDAADSNDSVAHRPAVSVNSRIRWIYFIMGCAVLLPWNGAYGSVLLECSLIILSLFSNDHGYTLFPI